MSGSETPSQTPEPSDSETIPQTPEPVLVRMLPLSPTEKTVFRLLANGLTEKEISETMKRSPNTVHVHVRNIYRKLGINRRDALLDLYRQYGEGLVEGRVASL